MGSADLVAEYALVQGKMDKIGDFMFMIKGWTVTVASGIVVGENAWNLPPWILLTSLPVVFLFWALEARQQVIRTILARRAFEIERALEGLRREQKRADANGGIPPIRTPSIGLALTRSRRADGWSQRIFRYLESGFYVAVMIMLVVATGVRAVASDPSHEPAESISVITIR